MVRLQQEQYKCPWYDRKFLLDFVPRDADDSYCGNSGSEMIVNKQSNFCELCWIKKDLTM